VDKGTEPAASAGIVPLEQVKSSVHSDLQYISIEVDGNTYGGWYRTLADGQMELLALANMHCERRPENTPIEQARGMLADFIRVARSKPKTIRSATANGDDGPNAERTLGDLLYADSTRPRIAEQEWLDVVQSIASGDHLALADLYQRTHKLVFTVLMRRVGNRQIAEDLTLEVFRDLPRQASHYDAATESVIGWIMNRAQSQATNHLRLERDNQRVHVPAESGLDGVYEIAGERRVAAVLNPSAAVWERLAQRIALETGGEPMPLETRQWSAPEWEEVAPGISCKLLATDREKARVSMLVRLGPGIDYPPHRHAGVEELHLLEGELWIDDRKLHAGDYNRADPGTADQRVWSETGCACVLITSPEDVLG
jgi:DNA-directed RNA polymerase specialized sigma24 family protein